VNEFCKATNVSRATVKEAIAQGEIRTVWVRNCQIIPIAEIKRLGLEE
jgi:hypothetical protein